MAREAKLEEERRLEAGKIAAMAEFLRIKEAERETRARLLQEKNQQKETEKELAQRAAEDAIAIGTVQNSKQKWFKKFTGPTHISKCHPSRETLDFVIFVLFTVHFRVVEIATIITTALAQLAMPVEIMRLNPFSFPENEPYSRIQTPNTAATPDILIRRPRNILPPLRPRHISRESDNSTSRLFHGLPLKMQSAGTGFEEDQEEAVTLSQELGYIRRGSSNGQKFGGSASAGIFNSLGQIIEDISPSFKAGRKYFITELSEPIHDIETLNSSSERFHSPSRDSHHSHMTKRTKKQVEKG
ncbi:hypothetical protein HK100_009761 [Physocladia obscura]|uniref:Uncharacterized protein n=1 Tax=Physocladia obscura TaxID=109957 RepID=A0AAD5T934_9FUNG|nr:hypothetical protein HK100_009761 [Physocladia obscura]